VLSALYFESTPPATAHYGEVDRILARDFADAIPLYLRFRTRGRPIVGTTLEYFDYRGLRIAAGRQLALIGECVVGAEVAAEEGLVPGDALVSSPESAFDLGGVYPLELRVVGVLARSHGPDDRAVFVDVKTSWIIEGLGHGHQDLAAPGAARDVLERDDRRITAKASVVQFNRITEENIDSFHFHGDLSGYPISAVIAIPRDARSRALLLGRYEGAKESQIARPRAVMEELLDTVFTVRRYVVAALALVATATLTTGALVFFLSFRLRRREVETLVKIGGSRGRVAAVLASEVVFVLALALALAGLLTIITTHFGSAAIREVLLS
jgi:putative ABC transport system permease protein